MGINDSCIVVEVEGTCNGEIELEGWEDGVLQGVYTAKWGRRLGMVKAWFDRFKIKTGLILLGSGLGGLWGGNWIRLGLGLYLDWFRFSNIRSRVHLVCRINYKDQICKTEIPRACFAKHPKYP